MCLENAFNAFKIDKRTPLIRQNNNNSLSYLIISAHFRLNHFIVDRISV